MAKYICEECGEVFRRKPSYGKNNVGGIPRFCSLKCGGKHAGIVGSKKNLGRKFESIFGLLKRIDEEDDSISI